MRLRIAFVSFLLGAVSVQAQSPSGARADSSHGRRKPATAAMLSAVLPGAGHIYAGQTLAGFAVMTLEAVAVGGALQGRDTVSMSVSLDCTTRQPKPRDCFELSSYSKQRTWTYGAVGIWLAALVTAPLAAKQHNRDYGFALTPTRDGRTNVGLSLRF